MSLQWGMGLVGIVSEGCYLKGVWGEEEWSMMMMEMSEAKSPFWNGQIIDWDLAFQWVNPAGRSGDGIHPRFCSITMI